MSFAVLPLWNTGQAFFHMLSVDRLRTIERLSVQGGIILLDHRKKETVNYTVERKFLNRISAPELISRLIRSHGKKQTGGTGREDLP